VGLALIAGPSGTRPAPSTSKKSRSPLTRTNMFTRPCFVGAAMLAQGASPEMGHRRECGRRPVHVSSTSES
jgi:hypothetical protein